MPERGRTQTLKERLTYEAARIMVEQGLSDFDRARRKAAERTGILDRRHWPTNEAVQEAIMIQRRLFADCGPDRWDPRAEAIQAMRLLHAFSPRLIGTALSGSGDRRLGVELLLFAERPEDVLFDLIERRIPWQEGERSLRYPDGRRCTHPVFRFLAGETPFELIVLPPQAQRHPPLDPVTDRPQRGASLAEVERLLAAGDSRKNS